MTSARTIIQRICEETGVQPTELLGVLLEALQQSHTFHAGLAMSNPNHPPGVEGEIDGLCQMVGAETPDNLLAALRLAASSYALPAAVNARDARARGNDIEAGSLERSVEVVNALRRLLQNCIDDAGDFRATGRPTMEKRASEGAKPEGSKIFRDVHPGQGGPIGEISFED